jgi:hypothetical protein
MPPKRARRAAVQAAALLFIAVQAAHSPPLPVVTASREISSGSQLDAFLAAASRAAAAQLVDVLVKSGLAFERARVSGR